MAEPKVWVFFYGSFMNRDVLAECSDGRLLPALCYISAAPAAELPRSDYVDRIVRPARDYGFPDWYVARLESFRRGPGGE